jgi:hypothetical protein
LIAALNDYISTLRIDIHAVQLPSAFSNPKVTAFVDLLCDEMRTSHAK